MVKNAFILIMVTLTMVKESNMLPGYLNVILHIVVGFIALASDVLVFKFYGSLPDFKKSVLTYMVRLLVVASGIAVVWYNLAAIILEFSFYISPWVAEYPNTCCTLLRAETVCEVMLVAIIMIQLCKACIVFNSLFFLSMDHERVFKFSLVVVLVIFMTHNSLALFFAGTLCPLPKLSRILRLNKIKVPEEMKKTAPPLIFIYFIITFLATIILKFVKRIKNKNQRINPVVPQNFPTISGMLENLKKNSIYPTNMNIPANSDERNQPSQFVSNVERNDPETAANDQPITSAQISGKVLLDKQKA